MTNKWYFILQNSMTLSQKMLPMPITVILLTEFGYRNNDCLRDLVMNND